MYSGYRLVSFPFAYGAFTLSGRLSHTLSSVCAMLLFLPCSGVLSKLALLTVPDSAEEAQELIVCISIEVVFGMICIFGCCPHMAASNLKPCVYNLWKIFI